MGDLATGEGDAHAVGVIDIRHRAEATAEQGLRGNPVRRQVAAGEPGQAGRLVAAAIGKAIGAERRVVVEHFDLIHEALGYNAQVLFGIGDSFRTGTHKAMIFAWLEAGAPALAIASARHETQYTRLFRS